MTSLLSQQKTLLSYDVFNQNLDSITVFFDETITEETTPHFIGNFNFRMTTLDSQAPESNLWEGTTFTRKQRASDDFDLLSYPIRTTVKTFLVDKDSLIGNCSGSMISSKHALIAIHCLTDLINDTLANFDDIYVCPVFDDGMNNPCFDCTSVRKIFYFENWDLPEEDIAVLELNTEIGRKTGWIGIGFNGDDAFYTDKVFHKFSYPGVTIPQIDPNEYNGDTLYYSYGLMDIISPVTLGIENVLGIPGESGSSIIHVDEDDASVTYGVLSLGSQMIHSRLNNWMYFSIKEIIKDDWTVSTPTSELDPIFLFPNPSNGKFSINGVSNFETVELEIYDTSGKLIVPLQQVQFCEEIDISHLVNGLYYISILVDDFKQTEKIILAR